MSKVVDAVGISDPDTLTYNVSTDASAALVLPPRNKKRARSAAAARLAAAAAAGRGSTRDERRGAASAARRLAAVASALDSKERRAAAFASLAATSLTHLERALLKPSGTLGELPSVRAELGDALRRERAGLLPISVVEGGGVGGGASKAAATGTGAALVVAHVVAKRPRPIEPINEPVEEEDEGGDSSSSDSDSTSPPQPTVHAFCAACHKSYNTGVTARQKAFGNYSTFCSLKCRKLFLLTEHGQKADDDNDKMGEGDEEFDQEEEEEEEEGEETGDSNGEGNDSENEESGDSDGEDNDSDDEDNDDEDDDDDDVISKSAPTPTFAINLGNLRVKKTSTTTTTLQEQLNLENETSIITATDHLPDLAAETLGGRFQAGRDAAAAVAGGRVRDGARLDDATRRLLELRARNLAERAAAAAAATSAITGGGGNGDEGDDDAAAVAAATAAVEAAEAAASAAGPARRGRAEGVKVGHTSYVAAEAWDEDAGPGRRRREVAAAAAAAAARKAPDLHDARTNMWSADGTTLLPKVLSQLPPSSRAAYAPTYTPLPRTAAAANARTELPVVRLEQEIMEAIYDHDVVFVAGETGSGKTTQVPQFLLEAGFGLPRERIRIKVKEGKTEGAPVAPVKVADDGIAGEGGGGGASFAADSSTSKSSPGSI